MAKRGRQPPQTQALFTLDQLPTDDQGLSLEELSQAYASLLQKGDDPYEPAPDTEPAIGPPELEAELQEEEPEEAGDEQTPEAHDDACPVTPRSIFEAMLFVGHPDNEPLSSEKVASLMRGVRAQEVDALVVELNRAYEDEGCPYQIESVGHGYRLSLREELSALRDKFYGRLRAAKLSQTAIDVLAVVAYKQPVTREDIDRLRGKPSGGLLAQLVRRELLRIERPTEKPRIPRYFTTPRFLQLFGLESLADLPKSPDGSF